MNRPASPLPLSPDHALPAAFYARDTTTVARELLGMRVCHRLTDGTLRSGLIVETEAYLGVIDKAAHSYAGRHTARTQTMFGPPGRAYVYLIYGLHHCLNAVTGSEGVPEAVLIRALVPEQGLELWQVEWPRLRPHQWLSGPGRLCRGMGISLAQNGSDLCGTSPLWIEPSAWQVGEVACGPRIGIDYAGEAVDWPLRFYAARHPAVSAPARR